MGTLRPLRAAAVAGLVAIGLTAIAGPALSLPLQPPFKTRAECVKYCEQKCERVVTNGRCQQACANRNGCF
jgi:hypothetical protein